MAVYRQSSRYCYNNDHNSISEEAELSGILDIFVHHARNIHNICIYENQDVYAKLSLTYNPDDTISTRIINGGGKNPDFNEKLAMKVNHNDAVLKCEIWMLSRVQNLLEDQLLGFALVPLSMVACKGKVTEEFSLSSTDLIHSPAGTVKLSLSLNTCLPLNSSHVPRNSSITSEVVFLDRNTEESIVEPIDYSRIEFPDINIVHQNQKMVSEYFNLATSHSFVSRPNLTGQGSFLHLGASLDDSEMTLNSSEETSSGLLSSTTTNMSDDNRNTADSVDKEIMVASELPNISPDQLRHENELNSSANEAEQSAMQQQIVDMYMKSMHQFTESLANMKLPMDVDKAETQVPKTTIQPQRTNKKMEVDNKDGSRVFYGSRAFF